MSDDRYQRLNVLFDALCDLPGAERTAALERLRGEDAPLAAELAELLSNDAPDAPLFDADPVGALSSAVQALGEGHGGTVDGPPPPASVGPYRLGRELGRGGAGTVYEAEDTRTGAAVAVKLLRRDRLRDARSVRRFRREYRAVARLDHPGCIRVHDEGVDEGRCYFVMELLQGGDLRQLIGAPTATILTALIQVATALDHVHSRGIVHRDLKPDNVLLAQRDPIVCKLADFGIAQPDTAATRLTGTGHIIGTIDYLAPEQVDDGPIDARADLYAFGCMTFELFSGRLPFEGSAANRLSARVNHRAPRLNEGPAAFHPTVTDLVARLLARDPAGRVQRAYQVAHELAGVLAEVDSEAAERLLSSPPAQAGGGFLYRAPLVGRERDLEDLQERVGAQLEGHPEAPVALVLCAEPGLGKTALVEALSRRLVDSGSSLIRVDTHPELPMPLAPLADVANRLRALCGARPDLAHLVGDERLDTAGFPLFGSRPFQDEAGVGRRRRADWLARALAAVSRRRRLLIVIEDMHHADESAWALLGDLLSELANSAVRPALIVTLRPSGLAKLDAVAGAVSLARCTLAPLTDRDARAFTAAMLGAGPMGLPDGLSGLLARGAAGNPLWLGNLLHDLVERGALQRVMGGWKLDAEAAGEVGSPNAIIGARLSHLSSDTRDVLRLAAVLGHTFDGDLLEAVSGRPPETVLDALDEAIRADLVRPADGPRDYDTYAFAQAHIVPVLAESLDDEARTDAHERIGRVLAQRSGTPAAVLAHHLGRGRDDGLAYEALRCAAVEARDASDHESAARHLAAALVRLEALGADRTDERASLMEALADAWVRIGRSQPAAELLDELLAEAGADRLTEARLRRKLGYAHLLSNRTQSGVRHLETALCMLEHRPPRGPIGALWRLVWDLSATALRRWLARPSRPSHGDEERALSHRELALLRRYIDLYRCAGHTVAYRRLAERLGDPLLRVDAASWYAVMLSFAGLAGRAERLMQRTTQLAEAVDDTEGLARLQMMQSGSLVLSGRFEASRRHMARALELARRSGDRFLLSLATSLDGWWTGLSGRWSASEDQFERARQLADELDLRWLRADAGAGLGFARLNAGRFEEARTIAEQTRADAADLGLPALEAMAGEALAWVAFLSGEYADAYSHWTWSSTSYRANRLNRAWGFTVNFGRSEALLWQVEYHGAAAVPDLVPQLRAIARQVSRDVARIPLFAGFDRLLRGVHAARRGQKKRAERYFARALAARRPLERNAWDLWVSVRAALERRRLDGARAALTTAFDDALRDAESFGLQGIGGWLERVRRDVGA